jgi:hypothetical protein
MIASTVPALAGISGASATGRPAAVLGGIEVGGRVRSATIGRRSWSAVRLGDRAGPGRLPDDRGGATPGCRRVQRAISSG